jgi:ADP-ribosylglycohydrolase
MIAGVTADFISAEFKNTKLKTYNLYHLTSARSAISSHSLMLAATADALLNDRSFDECYMRWGQQNTITDFDNATEFWLLQSDINYMQESSESGAAVRAGVIGMLDISISEIHSLATESSRYTHNSEEAITSAKVVCSVINAARRGASKEEIIEYLTDFNYYISSDYEELERNLNNNSNAKNVVLAAIYIALNSKDWEECIRLSIYRFGFNDTNSIAVIASMINAQTSVVSEYYKLQTQQYLFKYHQSVLQIMKEFENKKWMLELPF